MFASVHAISSHAARRKRYAITGKDDEPRRKKPCQRDGGAEHMLFLCLKLHVDLAHDTLALNVQL